MQKKETDKETAITLGCVVVMLVGLGLVLNAWASASSYRLWMAGGGVVLAIAGAWYSGLFHHADDPHHPRRRSR